jgi:hypothetical protein
MNFFDKALNDVDNLEQELLGPDYKYFKQVKMPSEMGMSGEGSISTLVSDIGGLMGYVQLLASGGGEASKVPGPLGDKFFLKTGAKCKDKKTGEKVTRSLYINNVPDGSIPFISSGLGGVNFTEMEGLVPGTLSNMAHINPMKLFQAFMMGSNPECQAITMETIDENNVRNTETAYVTTTDINSMSPCWFPGKTNTVTGAGCRETFENMDNSASYVSALMPNNNLVKIYYSILGLLGLYILMKIFTKKSI